MAWSEQRTRGGRRRSSRYSSRGARPPSRIRKQRRGAPVHLANESELVAGCDGGDADGRSSRRMKTLQRLYDDQMDSGTAQFAMYYKEWLKHGGDAPPATPSVPLPSTPWSFDKWEKHSSSLRTSSINRNLYNAVFGTSFEQEDAKLPDEAEYVLDMDVQLDENPGSLKMEKLAHVSQQFLSCHYIW